MFILHKRPSFSRFWSYWWNFHRLKVFLSRVMRCQEEEGGGEDDPPLVPRLGTRTGSTPLFSTTTRFWDMKQKRNYSVLTSRSIAKTSYTIRSSGVLLQTDRVFVMTFIVGVKSYMEVSNETSDNNVWLHHELCYDLFQNCKIKNCIIWSVFAFN